MPFSLFMASRRANHGCCRGKCDHLSGFSRRWCHRLGVLSGRCRNLRVTVGEYLGINSLISARIQLLGALTFGAKVSTVNGVLTGSALEATGTAVCSSLTIGEAWVNTLLVSCAEAAPAARRRASKRLRFQDCIVKEVRVEANKRRRPTLALPIFGLLLEP